MRRSAACRISSFIFFFQAEDGIRDYKVTGVQTCALPISLRATLLELRKLLERCHGPGERAHMLVERDTLGFDQGSPLVLDLRFVESASKQVGRGVEPLADQPREALLAQLEQATRLARGPFLASF